MQDATIFFINNTLGCFRVFVPRKRFRECDICKRSKKAVIKVTWLRNRKLFEHVLCAHYLTISCLSDAVKKTERLSSLPKDKAQELQKWGLESTVVLGKYDIFLLFWMLYLVTSFSQLFSNWSLILSLTVIPWE